MASKAEQAWAEVNERQRTYLKAFYDQDQALEEERGYEAARGRWDKTPARVWRRVSISGSYAPAPAVLRARGVWESGAGSTLLALTDRGLITYGDGWVLLTRTGRAAARAGLGIELFRKPKWALSEWLWRQLAKVASTEPDGLLTHDLWGTAHLYLQDGYGHEPGNRPYVHVVVTRGRRPGASIDWEQRRYHLTDTGRAHYLERLADYREMYPDIDAPDLPPPPPSQEDTDPMTSSTPSAGRFLQATARGVWAGWQNYWAYLGGGTGAVVAVMAIIALVTGTTALGQL